MVGAKRRVRIADEGRIALPADFMRKHQLKAGDEVAVEDTDQGMLITREVGEESMSTEQRPHYHYRPATPEELGERQAAIDRVLALRAQTPSIAPLTTADLVHMSRDDNFWYGEEGTVSNGTGD